MIYYIINYKSIKLLEVLGAICHEMNTKEMEPKIF